MQILVVMSNKELYEYDPYTCLLFIECMEISLHPATQRKVFRKTGQQGNMDVAHVVYFHIIQNSKFRHLFLNH